MGTPLLWDRVRAQTEALAGERSPFIPISDPALFDVLAAETLRVLHSMRPDRLHVYCDPKTYSSSLQLTEWTDKVTILAAWEMEAPPIGAEIRTIALEDVTNWRCLIVCAPEIAIGLAGLDGGAPGTSYGGWTGVPEDVHSMLNAVLGLPSQPIDAAACLAQCSPLNTVLLNSIMARQAQAVVNRRQSLAMDKGDLYAVLNILKSISAKRRSHDVLFVFVEEVAITIGADRCSVVRIWGTDGSGIVLASHDNEGIRDLSIELHKYPEIRRAYKTLSKVILNDALNDPLTRPFRSQLEKAGVGHILVVPIVIHDPNVGSLFLRATRNQDPFTEREVGFCEIVAEAASNALERAQLFDTIQQANERLERLAITDGLTGLYNYRHFRSRLVEEFERAKRYGHPLSCIIFDVDDFKSINDRFGHLQGDEVLREIAQRTLRATRQSDIVARYGGEEFAVIMPQTGIEGARAEANRLRNEVRSNPYRQMQGDNRVTISVGLAVMDHQNMDDCDALIRAADDACYRAKSQGKDRVVVSEGSES